MAINEKLKNRLLPALRTPEAVDLMEIALDSATAPYVPTEETDWDATVPTTVGEAIDQLAARVKALETP